MEKDFLNWDLTLKMKEIDFQGEFTMYIDKDNDIINDDTAVLYGAVPAILFSAAFRFFREKHFLDSHSRQQTKSGDSYWKISILETDGNIKGYSGFTKSFQEAEIHRLEKLIEIVKNKK